MMKKVLGLFALILLGFSGFVASKPDELRIAREITIHKKPEVIFPYLNNPRQSNDWMPWKAMDPHVVMKYAGPAEGVNAESSWTSSGQMGTGRAKIIESVPNQLVKTQLDYEKPFVMQQVAVMQLEPSEEATKLRWEVILPQNFIAKAVGVFMDMDQMIGKNFEQGLQNLQHLLDKDRV